MSDDIAWKIHPWQNSSKAPRAWLQSTWRKAPEGAVDLVFDIDTQGGKVELLLEVENSSQGYSIPPGAGRQQVRIFPFTPLAGRDFRFKLTACPPGEGRGFILYDVRVDGSATVTGQGGGYFGGRLLLGEQFSNLLKRPSELLTLELELDTGGALVDVVVLNNHGGRSTVDPRAEVFRFTIMTNGKAKLKLPLPAGTVNPAIVVDPDPREAGFQGVRFYDVKFTGRVLFVPNAEG